MTPPSTELSGVQVYSAETQGYRDPSESEARGLNTLYEITRDVLKISSVQATTVANPETWTWSAKIIRCAHFTDPNSPNQEMVFVTHVTPGHGFPVVLYAFHATRGDNLTIEAFRMIGEKNGAEFKATAYKGETALDSFGGRSWNEGNWIENPESFCARVSPSVLKNVPGETLSKLLTTLAADAQKFVQVDSSEDDGVVQNLVHMRKRVDGYSKIQPPGRQWSLEDTLAAAGVLPEKFPDFFK